MKITQTIELTRDERLAVNTVLNITGKISDATGMTSQEIFEYFLNNAKWSQNGGFHVDCLHQIKDIEREVES